MKIKEFVQKEWLYLILLLIPFIFIALYWNDFTDKIPVHWNFSGEIDKFTQKEIGVFLIPGLNVIFYIMFLLLPKIDPRKDNYTLFRTSYNVLRLSIIGFLFFINIIVFLSSLGYKLNVGYIVIFLTLVLFLIFGNFMGKLKSNYFVGIKTPWSLENQDIWNKTHRFSGKLWVSLSLIMIVITFILPLNILTVFYFIYIAVIVLVPIFYSYILYLSFKKQNNKIRQ
jgi:uncharacterized membrane protein